MRLRTSTYKTRLLPATRALSTLLTGSCSPTVCAYCTAVAFCNRSTRSVGCLIDNTASTRDRPVRLEIHIHTSRQVTCAPLGTITPTHARGVRKRQRRRRTDTTRKGPDQPPSRVPLRYTPSVDRHAVQMEMLPMRQQLDTRVKNRVHMDAVQSSQVRQLRGEMDASAALHNEPRPAVSHRFLSELALPWDPTD